MHEKEKTELKNKKKENEEQINLLDEFIKKVSHQINTYINKNEQQVKVDIKEKFETIFQVFDKESRNSINQEMMGIFKDILKGFIEINIKDIKEIYSKSISSFKHENKIMEEKIKNKLNYFYTENDNNKNYSLLLDEIFNPRLRCSFKDNKLNSSLMIRGKKMTSENSLLNLEKINSISEELCIFALTNKVKNGIKSKDFLNELLIKNNYLFYSSTIIDYLLSYYIYRIRREKKAKDKIEKQIAIKKFINDIYGYRKLLLKNFEINNNNILDSEIKKLMDSNKRIDLKINEEKGIITNIKKNINDLDHEIEELRKYFNNNEYLYSQIEKCSQTTITNLLEYYISNKDRANNIEDIGSNISSKIKDCIENATKILDDKNEDIKAIKSNLMKLNDKLNDKSPNIYIYILLEIPIMGKVVLLILF